MVGIYKITNKINGKKYVGQSSCIENRWYSHKRELNMGIHGNIHLQRAWNKYGEDNFEFSIIEECDIELLDEREIFWIDKLESYYKLNGYNITLGGGGFRKLTDDEINRIYEMYESKKYSFEEICESNNIHMRTLRRYLSAGGKQNKCNYDPRISRFDTHAVKVICLTTGEIFDSVNEAEIKYSVNGISACCLHKLRYTGRLNDGRYLLWMHLDEYNRYTNEKIEEYKNNLLLEIKSKNVVCLNNGMIFENTKLACEWCNLKNVITIQKCCLGKAYYGGSHPETGKKLAWVYYEKYVNMSQEEIDNAVKSANISPFTKKVICLNNSKIFDSPKIAKNWCNIENEELIKKCCRGEKNNAGRDPDNGELLTWMYYDDYVYSTEEHIKYKIILKEYTYSNPDRKRAVICLNNSKVFKSLKDAGEWCGLKNCGSIGTCIRSTGNKTCGKDPNTGESLRWMYYDDYQKMSS